MMVEEPGVNNILPANPLLGTDESSAGVTGQSNTGPGILGRSLGMGGSGPQGLVIASRPGTDGVLGEGVNGVRGVSGADYGSSAAPAGAGVWGTNTGSGPGVYGTCAKGDGVLGNGYHGVHGQSDNAGGAGVWGEDTGSGVGVSGTSTKADGVMGNGYHGVHGQSDNAGGAGVWGEDTGSGVGVSGTSTTKQGVSGQTTSGVAVYGQTLGSGLAGQFDGNVKITGDITSVNTITVQTDVKLVAADCAEQFDMRDATSPEPGTVLVIDDEEKLWESQSPYDKRVAGVVSGAGEYRPAIVLDRKASLEGRASIALVGKVYCKVDADPAPIAVGDLLTTSARSGFAMKATDSARAFGAVIGKALKPLPSGQGMIPILVALQ
jgi:hypothetical protein